MQSVRRTVAVLSGTVFLVMIGISIIVPALPQYGLHFGATAFLAGVLVGALPAARMVLDLPSGALGDRFGNRRMMRTGLAIIALTSAVAVVAFDYWVLLAVRVAEGVGSAFYVTSSLAALAKRVPQDRRGRYMGSYVNSLLVGLAIGPVIGSAVTLAWGLRAPFAAYSILASIGMMVITFGMDEGTAVGGKAAVNVTAVRRLLADRSYVIVNLGTMSAFFVRIGMITTVIPLFIAFNWGVSPTLAITFTGVLITTSAIANLLTLYPSGWVADRVGRKIPFVTSLVATGVVTPFLFFTRDLGTAIPVMFVYGLVLGLHGPLAAWTADLTPGGIMGTSMGLYRTIGDVGFVLGPVILAAVLDLTMVAGQVTIFPFLVASAWAIVAGFLMIFARDPVGESRRRAAIRAGVEATHASNPSPPNPGLTGRTGRR